MDLISTILLILGGVACYLLMLFQSLKWVACTRCTRVSTFIAFAFFILRACAGMVPPQYYARAVDFAVNVLMLGIICFVFPIVKAVFVKRRTISHLRDAAWPWPENHRSSPSPNGHTLTVHAASDRRG